MRWFVEISPLGQKAGPSTTLCVEAPQWQPALQKARALRGDNGALSNFSIELLEDGFRAIDPMTRLRYVVKRAPDDAVITSGTSKPPGSAADARPAEPAPASKPAEPAPASKPAEPAPASKPAEPAPAADASRKRPPAQTVAFTSSGAAAVVPAAAAAPAPAAAVPEPGQKRSLGQTAAYSSEGSASVREQPAAPPSGAPPPSFVQVGGREENPSDRSPLSYREYVYAVAPGTPEEDARRLILERFEFVRATLEPARAGKLINLAVFDHIFQGKPQRRPIATLTWKDWKNEPPELHYPQREAAGETPTPLAQPAKAARASQPAPATATAPIPAAPRPASTPAPASPAPVAAPAAPRPAPAAGATLSSAKPATLPKPEPARDVPVIAPAPAAPVPTPVKAADIPVPKPVVAQDPLAARAPSSRPAATVASPVAKPAPAPAAAPTPESKRPPAPEPARPESKRPPAPEPARASTPESKRSSAPEPAASAVAAVRPTAAAAPASSPAAAPAAPKKRLSGDDLLAELFEAFGDLHFLRDSLEGADFVLALTLEQLPSEVGMVSLFDLGKREFVVVRQSGGPRSALCARQPEKASLATAAMRKRHAIVVSDQAEAARAADDRWGTIGVELRSLICAPVELGGRYLGLIELANPLDGGAFNEGDGNALTYIGQQFAEFVAARGVIVDPEHIREPPKPAPQPIQAQARPDSKRGR
jgi:hypothetical protein